MRGVKPPGDIWIGVAGLDLVRDHDGEWLVLEDNVRTPSGFAYLHATRRALLEHIAVAARRAPRPLDGEIDLLADTLRAVAPESARGRRAPQAAVLTDGEHNSAYWEHAWLSRQLGIPLVEPDELEVRATATCGSARGLREPRRIDVIYRRTNADRLDSDIGRLLIEPVRDGTLGLVNQYGTGVADDKLTHAYVEDMIRFYVGEEPVLRSVPTYDLAQPAQLEEALDVFDELVLKPRAGHGGVGVLIAPRSSRAEIDATRAAVIADPGAWIAQRMVMLSTHPTVVEGGRLAPRHIDLRPFVFLGEGAQPRVLPGGLTRVARSEGQLVVNSSQNGGAKDTWVMRQPRATPRSARALRDAVDRSPQRQRGRSRPPRVADARRASAARAAAAGPANAPRASSRRRRASSVPSAAAPVLHGVSSSSSQRRGSGRPRGQRAAPRTRGRSRPRAARGRRRRRGSAARRPGSARACPRRAAR